MKRFALPDFDDEMPTRVGLRMPRRRSVSAERQNSERSVMPRSFKYRME
ncbi:MAG: hypothetical protein R3C25_10155 [Hyphomonadaceae bacterium]